MMKDHTMSPCLDRSSPRPRQDTPLDHLTDCRRPQLQQRVCRTPFGRLLISSLSTSPALQPRLPGVCRRLRLINMTALDGFTTQPFSVSRASRSAPSERIRLQRPTETCSCLVTTRRGHRYDLKDAYYLYSWFRVGWRRVDGVRHVETRRWTEGTVVVPIPSSCHPSSTVH